MARATLISRTGGATLVNGFYQYNLTHVYQVLTGDLNSSTITVLNWPGVPRAGAKAILGGQTVWVGRPTVNQPDLKQSKFLVTVPYSNQTSNFERDVNGNPVSNPTEIVKKVSIDWQDVSEPVTQATLRSITHTKPESQGGTTLQKPSWLPEVGPVSNSAGEPVFLERQKRIKVITVQKVVRNWDESWSDYQNAINTDKVTIEVRDSEGVRATHVFPKWTLKMTIRTPEEWRDGKLYFRPTFIMEHNPETWIHAELDRGTKRRVFVGQYNPKGGQYDQADLTAMEIDGDHGFASILTDNDTVAIGEPVLFNGSGAEQPLSRSAGQDAPANKPVFLNYDVELNLRSYASLNL